MNTPVSYTCTILVFTKNKMFFRVLMPRSSEYHDVSEERIAQSSGSKSKPSEKAGNTAACCFLAWLAHRPWRWIDMFLRSLRLEEGRNEQQAGGKKGCLLVYCSACSSTLYVGAILYSESSVSFRSTHRHNPEEGHRCGNLKPYIFTDASP
jgi:hypothetical protein